MKLKLSLKGIDTAINNLAYRNPNIPKYRLIMAIRKRFENDNELEKVQAISSDSLIPEIWDTGEDPEAIRMRRKNFVSLIGSINNDLKKLIDEELNPEGVIINKNNTFEMSSSMRDKLLQTVSGMVGADDNKMTISRLYELLAMVKTFLDRREKGLDDPEEIEKLKKLLEEFGSEEEKDKDSEIIESEEDEEVEEVDEDSEIVELDEDEELEEVDDDSEIVELGEDEELEEIDDDSEIVELGEDEELEEVDDDSEIVELGEDEELEEIDDDSEIVESGEDEELEEVDDDSEIVELGEDEELEEIDEDSEIIEVDENEELEEIDDDSEIVESGEDEELEEIDGDSEIVESGEDEELEEIDGDSEIVELGEDEELEEIDEDSEIIEVDEDEELEEGGIGEEDIEEVQDLLDSDEVEEIELDEDELDPDLFEEIVDEDEAEEEKEESQEELGLLFENSEDFSDYDPDDAEKNRLLAERFDAYLGAMERFYNQYPLIDGGEYTIGSKRPNKLELREKTIKLSPFYIGRFPITNALFEVFVERTGYKTTAEKLGFSTVFQARFSKIKDPQSGEEKSIWQAEVSSEKIKGACWFAPEGPGSNLHGKRNHPVVQVSLEDARRFSAWIGKRLPLEEEWEAAARTRKALSYPWGDEWEAEMANTEDMGLGGSSAVDAFPKGQNSFSLMDLTGNVLEWTQSPMEGFSPKDSHLPFFICKGGSFVTAGKPALWARYPLRPDFSANILGFRCLAE